MWCNKAAAQWESSDGITAGALGQAQGSRARMHNLPACMRVII